MSLFRKVFVSICSLSLVSLLSACVVKTPVLFDPQGPIGAQEKDLLILAVKLMLIVIIPVIILVFAFAIRYRASSKKAKYDPDFSHSVALEVFWWSIPIIIIVILATITWKTTHELDPYQPIGTAQQRQEAVKIQVIALPGQWLFIYPQYHIATMKEIAFPISTPVDFYITSDAAMNSFQIPQLGGQIYAMAGMQTKLHLIADKAADYAGRSVSFSGPGFTGMTFTAKALAAPADFQAWVKKIQGANHPLTQEEYNAWVHPTPNPTGPDSLIIEAKAREFSSLPAGCFFGDVIMGYLHDAHGNKVGMSMPGMNAQTFCDQK